MHRLRLRAPSPALAVATVALFVALGGTAVASFGPFKGDAIIKKHSLSGNRLKNGTITGSQINLQKLGKVPSASHADTAGSANTANSANTAANAANATNAVNATNATNAANASTVSGQSVTPIFATVAAGAAAVQVYSKQGLTLTFSCPTSTNDQVVANGPAAANDNLVVQGNGQAGAFQSRTEHMGPSSNVVIGSGNYGTGVAEYGTSDGHVVSVTYGFDDANSGISSDCSLWGNAVSG